MQVTAESVLRSMRRMRTPPLSRPPRRAAVIGAGVAGSACARWLADGGWSVQLFDKSRGAGGRLATRRATWTAPDGREHRAAFDHGAPGFSARGGAFAAFVEQAARDGLLAPWSPRLAPGSYAPLDDAPLWVPVPDMPALCRALAAGVPLVTGCTVDTLEREAGGWQLLSGGQLVGEGFDAVVLTVPAPQAVPLLRPHDAAWAARAQAVALRPGWTLMGVSDDPGPAAAWDLAWPPDGPCAWIVRNDAKPGRSAVPGFAHWVVHATPEWSRTHLEAPAGEVQAQLQAALDRWLGVPLAWHHVAMHRWRYASVLRSALPAAPCQWDAALGLGQCGDAPGGAGVEGAWLSARALAAAMLGQGDAAP